MSRARLADAFDTAAEAMAQLAHELRAGEQPAPQATPQAAPSLPAERQEAAGNAPAADSIDRTRCPAHNREWKEGTYGPFCSAKSDDPAWSKENKKTGERYCSVTPKNAPDWLRVHGIPA